MMGGWEYGTTRASGWMMLAWRPRRIATTTAALEQSHQRRPVTQQTECTLPIIMLNDYQTDA